MSSINYKYIKIAGGVSLGDYRNGEVSFWQSLPWIEILRDTLQARDIILCSNNKDQILIERRSIVGSYTGLYILGVESPLITSDLLEYIRREIAQEHDLFLQIEPLDDVGHKKQKTGKAPFRRFIEPVTAQIDLQGKTEESLLQSFSEKGRYNIRLAQKRGVVTRWVKGYDIYLETGKTYLEEFFHLLDETTKRDGFAHNSLIYYQYFVEILEAHNAGGFLVAEKEGILHAAGIFTYWGDTGIYYYGASSSNSAIRRDMATYLLQWEAIREAMRRNCTVYDFLGISPDGKGKLAGVTEFKLRFNPERKILPSEIVVIYKPFLTRILQGISKVRKLFR